MNLQNESARYVSSARESGHPFNQYIPNELSSANVSNILDVGCGEGAFSHHVSTQIGVPLVGVEPSLQVVENLRKSHEGTETISFEVGSASSLPFEDQSFDLVMVIGVLAWVQQGDWLRSVSELERVSRRYIWVRDFHTVRPFRVPYRHVPGWYSFRRDFSVVLTSGGSWSVVDEHYSRNTGESWHELSPLDFEPFEGNPNNYWSWKDTLFKFHEENLFPIRTADFFNEK